MCKWPEARFVWLVGPQPSRTSGFEVCHWDAGFSCSYSCVGTDLPQLPKTSSTKQSVVMWSRKRIPLDRFNFLGRGLSARRVGGLQCRALWAWSIRSAT